MSNKPPLRLGIGGPVGSGKTALLDRLCKKMRERYQIAVVTNDIYTREDAEFLVRSGALDADRIVGVIKLWSHQRRSNARALFISIAAALRA